jgi:hypothetical protein
MAAPRVQQSVVVLARPEDVRPRLLAVAGVDGYELLGETRDGFSLRRRRVPLWAILLAVFMFPFGLLFLLVKSEEIVTVTLERVPAGTSATTVGRASARLMTAIHAALGSFQLEGAPAPGWYGARAGTAPPPPPRAAPELPRMPTIRQAFAMTQAAVREARAAASVATGDTPSRGMAVVDPGPAIPSSVPPTAALREEPSVALPSVAVAAATVAPPPVAPSAVPSSPPRPAPPAPPVSLATGSPGGGAAPPLPPPTPFGGPAGGFPGGGQPMPLGPIGGSPGGALPQPPPPLGGLPGGGSPGGLGPIDLPEIPRLDPHRIGRPDG